MEERPWGWWKIVHDDPVTKIICVNPGQMLSLQFHRSRVEYWIPFEDGLIGYKRDSNSGMHHRNEDAFLLRARNTYSVSPNTVHRLVNPTGRPLSLIEIITGNYNESDIVRLHDNWGR